jgi:site-specific DNA-methyltransferase (adenine-specific)
MPISEVKCCDCMDFMAQFPDKFFDLAIVDPPYGLDITNIWGAEKYGYKQYTKKEWDKEIPKPEYFEKLLLKSKHSIIWGGNYFANLLPNSSCWIVWDKGQRDFTLADGELAWTSFNKSLRIFEMSRSKAKSSNGNQKIHPTQKPIELYLWCLDKFAKPGDKILDTHMGSQSSRIAAWKMGFDYWGCEIDQEYFDQGCARFEEEKRQLSLFAQPDEPEQEALF